MNMSESRGGVGGGVIIVINQFYFGENTLASHN